MIKLVMCVAAFAQTLLLTGCLSTEKVIREDFNKEGEPLNISIKILNPARFKVETQNWSPILKGEAVYYREGNDCQILIKRTKTLKVDDKVTLTLGHEVMHCLYGDYHK